MRRTHPEANWTPRNVWNGLKAEHVLSGYLDQIANLSIEGTALGMKNSTPSKRFILARAARVPPRRR